METIHNRTTATTAPYWSILKNLNSNEKLELIVLLSQSLKENAEESVVSAKDFYGIWGDDGFTDDDFIKEIKAARRFRHEIVEL